MGNHAGRHALVIDKEVSKRTGGPALTSSLRAVLLGLKRMATECPYWDVSYLVAVSFTVGCAIFIACGLFSWLPLVAPSSEFEGESTVAKGVTACVGATLFQIGAVLLVFEACNENQPGCFGWAVHRALHHDSEAAVAGADGHDGSAPPGTTWSARPHHEGCSHHYHQRRGHRRQKSTDVPWPKPQRRWEWWPSWDELTNHYIYEVGWLGSMTLALGATVFYVTGICTLPGIYSNMSTELTYGLYSLTYLVGGVLFIVSSVLYILETQPNWYTPAPHLLGWHIGVWNLIGAVGWTLAASLGYCKPSWCTYQSELTLTWASAAFFIGSALLWYEALSKYPVEGHGNRS